MLRTKLSTTAEVIDAIGGVARVMEVTGGRYKAVHNWKSFEKFPAKTYLAMQTALHERGMSAPASLWGMTENVEVAQ